MNNRNLALTIALALGALAVVVLIECFLVKPTETVRPVEPEETVTPEEPKEPERPIIIIPVEPVEAFEEPHPPLPPEPSGRPYNPLYQWGYGEPNESDAIPAPIEPGKRLLKDGWIIMVIPDGVVEPVVEHPWVREHREPVRKRLDALKVREEEWKHRA